MQFRKKPVVIEATQWFKNGDHPLDDVWRPFEDTGQKPTEPREGAIVRYFRIPGTADSPCKSCGRPEHDHGWVENLLYGHMVCPGDWIITGVKGEKYPCKDGIFKLTYEPVSDSH